MSYTAGGLRYTTKVLLKIKNDVVKVNEPGKDGVQESTNARR